MRGAWWPKLCMLGLLAVAAVLRFWGLRWGLPNSLHSYSYHPDEFLIVGAAGSVLLTFFPRFYNYPSLFIYLTAIGVLAGSAYGLAHTAGDAYLIARLISALMGVAAVGVVYWAGMRLWGVSEAIVAALVLCIAPLHVQHSHFGTVDVPSTLFVAACIGFAGMVLARGTWRDYVLCGVMAGLAGGTKYNAGLVVFSLIAAHLLGNRDRNAGARRLIVSFGCAIAAFVASTPAVLVHWPEFIRGVTYEMRHAATGHGLVFAGTGNGFVYTFLSSLWYGLGPALGILFAASAIYGLYKVDRRALTILAFVVPYYALISLSEVRFARYTLPMFPAAALLIGWMVCDLLTRFPKRARWAWATVTGAALIGTLLYTIALDRLFVQTPPQDRAARWIFANIPRGSDTGTIEVPWFYSPPLSKTFGYGGLPQRMQGMLSAPYRFRVLGQPEGDIKDSLAPTWYVFSDYEISDAQRLRHNESISKEDQEHVKLILDGVRLARSTGAPLRTFADHLSAAGISFGSTQLLPHDMRYPAPTIWIYGPKR